MALHPAVKATRGKDQRARGKDQCAHGSAELCARSSTLCQQSKNYGLLTSFSRGSNPPQDQGKKASSQGGDLFLCSCGFIANLGCA